MCSSEYVKTDKILVYGLRQLCAKEAKPEVSGARARERHYGFVFRSTFSSDVSLLFCSMVLGTTHKPSTSAGAHFHVQPSTGGGIFQQTKSLPARVNCYLRFEGTDAHLLGSMQ